MKSTSVVRENYSYVRPDEGAEHLSMQALEALLDGDSFLNAVFLQSELPKAILSSSGQGLLANAAMLTLLEQTNVKQGRSEIIECLDIEEREAILLAFEILQSKQRSEFQAEVLMFARQASAFYAELRLTRIAYDESAPPLVLLEVRDVSNERMQRDSLVESERIYRSLVELSNDLIWSLDEEGRWAFLNKNATKAIYGKERETMIGRHFSAFSTRENVESDRLAFQKVLEGQECITYETEHLREDGTVVALRFHAVAVRDESGQCRGVTGTAVDVTALKQAEAELARQRAFLRQVIDLNPNLVYAKNREGQFILVNQAVAEIYGVSKDYLLSKSDADLNRDASETKLSRELEREIIEVAQKKFIPEERIVDAQGRVRVLQTVKQPLFDERGEAVAVLGVATDFTARRKAELALQEIAEVLSSGVGTDLFAGVAQYLQKTYGVSHALIAEVSQEDSQYADILALHSATERLSLPQRVLISKAELVALAGGELHLGCLEVEKEHFARELLEHLGGYHYAVNVLRDEEQQVLGFIMLADDSTIEKHLLLESSLRILGTRVRLEIERMRAEAEQAAVATRIAEMNRMESLAVLAGGIAHDFNNLLMGVSGNVALAEKELSPSSPVRSRLGKIAQSTQRATLLTNQMLEYSGRSLHAPKVLNLSEVLPQLLDRLDTQIGTPYIRRINEGREVRARVDLLQFERVIRNLLLNAAEAVEEGGRVVISLDEEFSAKDASYLVAIEVSDEGMGMDERTLQRIFDPFFSTKFPGRGMGLAEVRGIIRKHEGTIEVKSQVDVGTTVRLLLPALQPRERETENLSSLSSLLSSPDALACRVLLVEDERSVREVSRDLLRLFSCKVRCARDGRSALRLLKKAPEQFDLVLLDLTMPGMSGDELFLKIKEIREDLPVAICSGYAEADMSKEISEQMLGFVQKPFGKDALGELLYRAKFFPSPA